VFCKVFVRIFKKVSFEGNLQFTLGKQWRTMIL